MITRPALMVLLVALGTSACTGSHETSGHEGESQGPSPSETASSPFGEPWARLEARRFHMPSVPPGAPCPKTTRGLHAKRVNRISSGVLRLREPGIALGSGPVFPLFFFPTAFYEP